MYSNKLTAGAIFPEINATLLSGERINVARPTEGADWRLVVIYRGNHCPLCTNYLNQLETFQQELLANGIDSIAVSADSKAQLTDHLSQLHVSFPLAYGLTLEQMQVLGLYISEPRSAQETDHRFAEPGLFVVNHQGTIQVVDISNNPFVRPELAALVSGLNWIRNPNNNYPIRGTYVETGAQK